MCISLYTVQGLPGNNIHQSFDMVRTRGFLPTVLVPDVIYPGHYNPGTETRKYLPRSIVPGAFP